MIYALAFLRPREHIPKQRLVWRRAVFLLLVIRVAQRSALRSIFFSAQRLEPRRTLVADDQASCSPTRPERLESQRSVVPFNSQDMAANPIRLCKCHLLGHMPLTTSPATGRILSSVAGNPDLGDHSLESHESESTNSNLQQPTFWRMRQSGGIPVVVGQVRVNTSDATRDQSHHAVAINP
ncbi:hypothetical protein F5Y18DRAFT_49139 [Xylariaceae sp. FL1019]|nr:hypothetical protein F5Y18DRAFT_49139 [Xylariaceae sp. FL1019]